MFIFGGKMTRLGFKERIESAVEDAVGGMSGQWHHNPETHYAPLVRGDVYRAKAAVDAVFREYLGMSYAQLPEHAECAGCSSANRKRVERERRRERIRESFVEAERR